jgi:hypothetical protein
MAPQRGHKRGRSSCNSSFNSAQPCTSTPQSYSVSLDRFSKAEQTILQAAAETLGVPVDRLIACAPTASGSTSSDELNTTDSPVSTEQSSLHAEATYDGISAPFQPYPADTPPDNPRLTVSQTPDGSDSPNDSFNVATSGTHTDLWMSNQSLFWDPHDPFAFNEPQPASVDNIQGSIQGAPGTFLRDQYLNVLLEPDLMMQAQPQLLPAPFTAQRNPQWPTSAEEVSTQSNLSTAGYTSNPHSHNHQNSLECEVWTSQDLAPSLPQPLGLPVGSKSSAGPLENQAAMRYGTESLPANPRKKQRRGRGPYKDQEKRKQTEVTRRMGACISCSLQRIRVRNYLQVAEILDANTHSVTLTHETRVGVVIHVFRRQNLVCTTPLVGATKSRTRHCSIMQSARG